MELGEHVLVIGTTGSGKSTVARAVAGARGLTYIELDSLHWEPGWHEADEVVFRDRLVEAMRAAGSGWVIDGNYWAKTEAISWPAAESVVALDLPLPLILTRLVRRMIRRSRTGEELWSGNRERLRSLVSRDSLLVWAERTHRRNRRRYQERLRDPAWSHLDFVRLATPRQVQEFLDDLGTAP